MSGIKKRFFFSNPKKSDIIIFDEVNSDGLIKLIKRNYSFTVIKQRPADYFITLSIIKLFILFLPKINFQEACSDRRGFIVGFLSELRLVYYHSLILSINPKAVITFIDNNIIFNQLSKTLKSIPFIAIQNGLRLPQEKADKYHVQHLFSFGDNEKVYFKKNGYEVEHFYPAGGLLSSLHFPLDKEEKIIKYDFLVVSCWRGDIGYSEEVKDSMNSMRIMDNLLSRYISINNFKAAIIFRNERDGPNWYMPEIGKNEEEYFKNIYPPEADFIEVDFKRRNIYELIDKSNLVVSGFLTTVLLEAYGKGTKIMYYNFTNLLYSDYSILDKSIVSSNADFASFSEELDQLISIEQEDYVQQRKNNMKHYMSYPADMKTDRFISDKIQQIVESCNKR